MRVSATLSELREARAILGGSVGLVPTMGALHDGHVAFVRRARSDTDHVAVSIFVNPTQFASAQDPERYPRDLDRDLAQLAREGIDVVFTPSADELSPEGFATTVAVGPIQRRLPSTAG